MSFAKQFARLGTIATAFIALAGCAPDYSPNTYSSAAVQQANKVDRGTVVGFREVKISSDGTVGAVTGGAAGGILGAQTDSPIVPTGLAALGGTVIGGLVGTTVEHTTGDTTGWEYIVRQSNGDLISVTQKEPKPIAIGQQVLVIEGKQARIVPDYAAASDQPPTAAPSKTKPASRDVPTTTSSSAAASAATTTTSAPTPAAAPDTASEPANAMPASEPASATPASATPASAAPAETPSPTTASPSPPTPAASPTPPAAGDKNTDDNTPKPPPS
jgi:outer membrane lipoprotein SlyB